MLNYGSSCTCKLADTALITFNMFFLTKRDGDWQFVLLLHNWNMDTLNHTEQLANKIGLLLSLCAINYLYAQQ